MSSFAFVAGWFKKAVDNARASGRQDSAQLWEDGLEHLNRLDAENKRLRAALDEAAQSLETISAIAYPRGTDDLPPTHKL